MKNTEGGLITGILVWDLSSAFDTLDIDLFLKKVAIYGADEVTIPNGVPACWRWHICGPAVIITVLVLSDFYKLDRELYYRLTS